MLIDITQDPEWAAAFTALDRAFEGSPRPDHFTDHTHCCECSDSDAFFQSHTPESFGVLPDPIETLPVAFLTEEAFRYLAPGILRYLARDGVDYNVGEVLFHLENRWQTFGPDQRVALRDLLYLVYERQHGEIHASAFDYEVLWRILNTLDEVAHT